MAPPGKGIDYSKWDNIADSDDEDAAPRPRTQVRLFVRVSVSGCTSCETFSAVGFAQPALSIAAQNAPVGQLQKARWVAQIGTPVCLWVMPHRFWP